jgi:uncharacterized protein (TIGR02466 family)
MKNTLYPLFAYPVVVCGDKYEITEAEKDYLDKLEMIDNVGNTMSKDDRILDAEPLSNLMAFINQNVFNYKKNLLHIKDDNEIYVTQSWVNRSLPEQFHPKHKHQNSIISGVMYLDEDSDDELPPIRFHRTHELYPVEFSYDELNEFNASCRTFEPKQGMLVLFPSLLEHDVEVNRTSKSRTSLSFNTYVRGIVGGKKQLTEIHIS